MSKEFNIREQVERRIESLESQLGNPEVLDQYRIEVKLEAFKECLGYFNEKLEREEREEQLKNQIKITPEQWDSLEVGDKINGAKIAKVQSGHNPAKTNLLYSVGRDKVFIMENGSHKHYPFCRKRYFAEKAKSIE